jgi:long-subunit acyl-CoA synthetase (AMP-forming)
MRSSKKPPDFWQGAGFASAHRQGQLSDVHVDRTIFKRAAEEIACGLRQLGIRKGDTVALHSETRAEFYLADLGILTNGSIAAALYTTYPFAGSA